MEGKDGFAGLTVRSADFGIGGDRRTQRVIAASADKSEEEVEQEEEK